MADVTKLIEQDHREVEELFAKFKQTKDASVVATICDELDRHTAGEEKAVYPIVADMVPGGKKMSDEAVDEHKEARQLIGRIRNTKDADHLADLVTELEQAIQHHVQEEETELLPKTRESLDPARLEQMGAEFEAAKQHAAAA
jgi:hemerythrin superfamily protein